MAEVRDSFGFPLAVALRTDVGRVRDNNEDAHGAAWLDDGSLFVIVADGMGGHDAGEVASGLAVQVVEEAVSRDPDQDPRERIYNALLEANEAILEEGTRSGTRGMGTTSITVVLRGSEVFVGLIGDSRCYQFRYGQLVWRTSDHTRVQMLIDQGQITEEESRVHPEAGMLTRALGHARMADGRPLVPDVLNQPLTLEEGDALVMCSDGLHDLLEDWEIGQAIGDKTPEDAAETLVQMACERGGHDNVTVAVICAGPRTLPYDAEFQPHTWAHEETEDNVTFDDPQEIQRSGAAAMYVADALVPDESGHYEEDDEPVPEPQIEVGAVSRPPPGAPRPSGGASSKGGGRGMMVAGVALVLMLVAIVLVLAVVVVAAVWMNM